MSRPTVQDGAASKVLNAAHDAARVRLQRDAERMSAAVPADGVLFSALWRRKGHAPVQVLLLWPGWLLELDPETGEIIAETDAAEMYAKRPEAAAFVERRAHGRPLLTVRYQPPGAEWRRVTVDARCVMRVHSVRSGDLLAESEPGKPRVMRAGFLVLAADDLSPRYT